MRRIVSPAMNAPTIGSRHPREAATSPERAAPERSERIGARFAHLRDLSMALSRALTPEEVARTVIAECVASLGVVAGAIGVYTEDQRQILLLGIEGYRTSGPISRRYISSDDAYPVADAARTCQPIFFTSGGEYAQRYPHLVATYPQLGAGAAVALPLLAENGSMGAIALRWPADRSFDTDEREFLETISQLCALGITRARLFATERAARQEAEQAGQRVAFLARASTLLASSLDYESTLTNVAQLAVPHIADWCTVHVVSPEGKVKLLAIAHVDPAKSAWAHELDKRYPYQSDAPRGVPNVLRTGEPELYTDVTDEMIARNARDAEHLELLRNLGLRSVIIVPMRGHHAVLGAISFVTTDESGRRYDEADLRLTQDLAQRSALAVENARLYRAEQHLAAIIASSEDAIVSKDLNGIVTTWNRAAERIYGWPAEEIIGRSKNTVIPPDLPDELPNILKKIRAGERIEHYETSRIHKDGRRFDASISVSPVRDANGNIVGASTIARDITERKATERALRENEARLRELNMRLKRAMAETHHRVKNNLQIIAALIDMELYAHTRSVPVESLRQVGYHIRTLSVIHDILTRQAREDVDLEFVAVSGLMNELLPVIQSILENREITVHADDAQLPIRSATALAVLLNELVSNAVKHGEGAIGVSFTVNGSRAQLVVTDHGPGFSAEFEQKRAQSTGLDLIESLAAWDLSGTVAFENRSEGGARVIVDFPLPTEA